MILGANWERILKEKGGGQRYHAEESVDKFWFNKFIVEIRRQSRIREFASRIFLTYVFLFFYLFIFRKHQSATQIISSTLLAL